jgi:molecular chaperone DnaK (HSP70)
VSGEKRPAVGLDFGTSTTLVASPRGIVPIGESLPVMPSLVGYGDDGAVVVGEAAYDTPVEQVVRSVKRSITDGRSVVRVDLPTGVRDVRADDLMAEVLREAVRRAAKSGQDLSGDSAVYLGCPAMWDGRQRRRLLDLAQRAGLPVTLASLVDEPVAAGIAWLASHATDASAPLRAVVFDMGGGTLDIAVLDVRGVHHRDVSVLAALGVAEAGDALDQAIAEDLDYVLGAVGVDVDSLSDPGRARLRLLDEAVKAKIALSTEHEYTAGLPRRLFGISEIGYTRDQLHAVFSAQMDRAEQFVAAALRVARLAEQLSGSAYDIARTPLDTLVEGVDVVILSGGMSHIPFVEERMRGLFPPTTRIEKACAQPEHAVALGLAQAAGYGRINMYRPAFDILAEWDEGREFRTVYEAFTPLVESWQIARGGSDLRFTRSGLDLSLPRQAKGRLRVVSHSGEKVRATLGGDSLDGFPVTLSEQKFEFSIFPNGRVQLIDASGTHEGHVQDWYTMHGHDHGERIRLVTPRREPDIPVPYPFHRDRD